MMTRTLPALALLLFVAGCGGETETAAPSGSAPADAAPADPVETGRRAFSACAICHTQKEGDKSLIGPNLFGVVGREAGSVEGFAYSAALADAEIVWTEDNLDAFLENPQAFLRGNRMAFAGEKNPEKRAALIAFLKTLN